MTFGEMFMELKNRATAILIYIKNQNYSALEKGFLGVRMLDIAAGFFLTVFIGAYLYPEEGS